MIPVSSIEYVNVRIRAAHSRLFGRDVYETLMESDNLGAVTTFLLENDYYRDDIEAALENFGEREGLEQGIANHFARLITLVRSMAEGDMKIHFNTVLASFDLQNLKTLIVARERDLPFPDICSMMLPCYTIDRDKLRLAYEMSDFQSMAKAISISSPHVAYGLRKTIKEKVSNEAAVEFINRLERNVYGAVLRSMDIDSSDASLVKTVFKYEIDLKNIVSAMKHVWGGVKEKSVTNTFIHGGTMGVDFLNDVAQAKKLEDALEMIEATRFHEAVEKGIIYYSETGFFHEMERFFEEVLIMKAFSMKRSDPFGIGPFIAYVWGQFTELTNLRTVINGIAFKASPGLIKRGLIYV